MRTIRLNFLLVLTCLCQLAQAKVSQFYFEKEDQKDCVVSIVLARIKEEIKLSQDKITWANSDKKTVLENRVQLLESITFEFNDIYKDNDLASYMQGGQKWIFQARPSGMLVQSGAPDVIEGMARVYSYLNSANEYSCYGVLGEDFYKSQSIFELYLYQDPRDKSVLYVGGNIIDRGYATSWTEGI